MARRPARPRRPGIPRHIERFLLDEENVVLAVRRHPAIVAEPVLSTVLGLVVVTALSAVIPPDVPFVVDVLWWVWFAIVLRALWRLAEWQNDWFLATDRRLLLTYGLVTRKVAMMPLAKVTDLSYNRSLVGRVVGYGEFVLESAGQDQAMRNVPWLPNPDELYRRICGEIFDGSSQAAPPEPEDDADLGTVLDTDLDGSDDPRTARVGAREQVTERIPLRQDPGDD